ncbi:MAG: hypothetical protein DMD91_31495 [Candidatus Rokuibacteriota bacterium]|nr:MAG: hypothetical protein DMD91_31495 [Candidatus Rokubacteria bacterium]
MLARSASLGRVAVDRDDPERLDGRGLVIAVVTMAILGGSYAMVKLGLRDLPVFGSLLLRMIVATVVLYAYSRWRGLPLMYRGRAARFLIAGTAVFVAQQVLLYLGLTMTTAGRAAILFNAQPFFTLLLLPRFVPSERLTARRGAGTALAFVGVVLVLLERGTAGGSRWGDLLVLLGALGWTGNTILNKLMPRELPTVSAILWSVAGAIPAMAVLTLLLELRGRWHVTVAAVGSVLYLGAVVAGLGFVVFVWLTRTYSPSRVNVFVFLSPVFGVLFGWAVLGEPISAPQALGGLAVAAGILLVNTGR